MTAKRKVRHRIYDVATTLLVIVVVTTLRSVMMPSGDESLPNVAVPLGELLQRWQTSWPTLSIFVWAFALMFAGMDAGRYGPKYSLYPAYTLMAMPIFGVLAAAVMVSGEYLLSSVAMLLMLFATKYLQRCIMRTDSYSDLSLAMLLFGILPLTFAPSALLYVVMPLLVLVVRSSWRDWVVAVSSLIFPLLSVSYWSWCAGDGFLTVTQSLYDSVFMSSEFSLFSTLTPASILLLGVAILMALCSVSLIISDRYSLKVKSRAVMRFNALMLVATVAMVALPSSTATVFALIAMPASMLIPLIFVRMGVGFTETLYRLLLVAAAANMVVMCL